MKFQILGTGCAKCIKLAELVEVAARELQLEYELEKLTDMKDIMSFGVVITPALVIDGVVRVSGKVPDIEGIKRLLSTQALQV